MITLFNKKDRSMPSLDEKEIQKKLYGSYKQGTMPKHVENQPVDLVPDLGNESRQKKRVSGSSWSALKAGLLTLILTAQRALKSISWRYAGFFIGGFIATIVLIQVVSFTFTKTKSFVSGLQERKAEKQERIAEQRRQAPAVTASVSTPVIKPEATAEVPAVTTPISAPQPVSTPPAPEDNGTGAIIGDDEIVGKSYAVQVCTYQRETDAVRLVDQLKKEGFEAFGKRMTSGRSGSSFYVVFLGRSESYQAAKAELEKFKTTQTFNDFSDSFIRSL